MYACDSAMFDYDTLKGLPGFCTVKNIQGIYLKKLHQKKKGSHEENAAKPKISMILVFY